MCLFTFWWVTGNLGCSFLRLHTMFPLFMPLSSHCTLFIKTPVLLNWRPTILQSPMAQKVRVSHSQCRRHRRCRFNLWVGKIPWRRKWQHTPYSCLKNPTDRGDWQSTIQWVSKSPTQLVTKHAPTPVWLESYLYPQWHYFQIRLHPEIMIVRISTYKFYGDTIQPKIPNMIPNFLLRDHEQNKQKITSHKLIVKIWGWYS